MSELPDGWEYRRIDQVGEVQLGRQRSPSMMSGRYMTPYLRVANVLDGYIDYSDVLEMNFNPQEAAIFGLQPGDILLNEGQELGLVGRCALFDGPPGICFQNTLVRFRSRSVLPRFAAAVFKHWLDHGEFRSIARQTTSIAHLGASQFSAMRFPLAPLDEQRRIMEILNATERAIDSSLNTIAKISLRQAGLIRSLLAESTAPERPLIDLLAERPRNGFSPNEVESWSGVVVLGLGCLTPHGFSPRQIKNVPVRDPRYSGSWLSDGDLLMSRSNTFELVGLVGRYRDVGTPCLYPDLMMKLTPKAIVRTEFLEVVMRDPLMRTRIQGIAQGTSGSMVKISGSAVMSLQVRVPGLAEQDRILETVKAGATEIQSREQEVAKLRLIKQGLMDDLLGGRVRVTSTSS